MIAQRALQRHLIVAGQAPAESVHGRRARERMVVALGVVEHGEQSATSAASPGHRQSGCGSDGDLDAAVAQDTDERLDGLFFAMVGERLGRLRARLVVARAEHGEQLGQGADTGLGLGPRARLLGGLAVEQLGQLGDARLEPLEPLLRDPL